jgi:hypothetical protein
MKFHKIGAIIGSMLLMAVAAAAQEKQVGLPGKPKLVIEQPIKDFGEIKPGVPIKHSFKIKNAGAADLIVHNVAPG